METLDEKLERLYGPQKQHYDQVLYKEFWEVYTPSEMEIYKFMKKHGRKPDGKETAEILLGHELN